ncbi:MAG: hypothetical protein D6805_05360 [Planctomycetota bacterium]|nr:MAG: hypothetical protein D6805_05360 [Planctomycetota bacterium]
MISLVILALLAVMGLTFFFTVSLERSASFKNILYINAKNVAQAGVERAIAELERHMIYEYGSPQAQKEMRNKIDAGQAYQPAYRSRAWETYLEPWHYAGSLDANTGRLDFISLEESTNDPKRFSLAAYPAQIFQGEAYSGTLGQTVGGREGAANYWAYYRLKILDCASMIYLNDTNTVNLKRILTNLFRALNQNPKRPIDLPNPPQLASYLVDSRPAEGYKTKNQIRYLLALKYGKVAGEKIFRTIQDTVTCHAWVDRSQILPLKASAASTADPIPPNQQEIRFQPRAPVNINTASKEVLIALLWGLKAKGFTISQAQAEQIATAIIQKRKTFYGAFKTWQEFYQWADQNFGGPNSLLSAILKANFNPNVGLNKFHPDSNLYRPLDKTDLEVFSQEFCFSSMGYFEITTLGRVLDKEGKVVSKALLQNVVQVYHVYRDTTQADFETDRIMLPLPRASRYGRHQGIISLPEYSNARDEWWRLINRSKLCYFDGQLILNGLVGQAVLPKDFILGFVSRRVIRSLDDLLAPNQGVAPGFLNQGTRPSASSESLFSPGTDHFFVGSDLFPLGVSLSKKRGRYFLFSGYNMPLRRGTIEFWVKPYYAYDPNSNTGILESYFFWGEPGNPAIHIYREDTDLIVGFALVWEGARGRPITGAPLGANVGAFRGFSGIPGDYREIFVDISNWKPGEWHHIMVTYGKYNYGNFLASDGRVYVDGKGSRGNCAPFATVVVNARTVGPVSFDNDPNRPPGGWQNTRVWIGRDPGGNYANATLDNFFVHNYFYNSVRLNKDFFPPFSRYYDQTFRQYQLKYKKRLLALEKQNIRLGTVSWTTYPSSNPQNPGKSLVVLKHGGKSLVNINQLTTAQQSGEGYSLRGYSIDARDNTQLFYLIDFLIETKGNIQNNSSPALDDVTITYFTTPQVKAVYDLSS